MSNADNQISFKELIFQQNCIEPYKEQVIYKKCKEGRSQTCGLTNSCYENLKTQEKKWNEILTLLCINVSNLKIGLEYSFTNRNQKFVIYMLDLYTKKVFKEFRATHEIYWDSEESGKIIQGFKEIMEDAKKDKSAIESQIVEIMYAMINYRKKEFYRFMKELQRTGDCIDDMLTSKFALNTYDDLLILNEIRCDYKKMINSWEDKWQQIVDIMSDLRNDETTEIVGDIDSDELEKKQRVLFSIDEIFYHYKKIHSKQKKQERQPKSQLAQAKKMQSINMEEQAMYDRIKIRVCKCFKIDPSEISPEKLFSKRKPSKQLFDDAIKEYNRPQPTLPTISDSDKRKAKELLTKHGFPDNE